MVQLEKHADLRDWKTYKAFCKEALDKLTAERVPLRISKEEYTFDDDWKGHVVLFGEKGKVAARKLRTESNSIKFHEFECSSDASKRIVADGLSAAILTQAVRTLRKLGLGYKFAGADEEGEGSSAPSAPAAPSDELQAQWIALKTVVVAAVKSALEAPDTNKGAITALVQAATQRESEGDLAGAIDIFQKLQARLAAREGAPAPAAGAGQPVSSAEVQQQAGAAVTKVTAGAGAAAVELGERLSDAVAKCPAVAAHLAQTLGAPGGTSIYFSDTAQDAFYSPSGSPEKGIPGNVIVLPNGRDPLDLVDGLIFETCNAEIQADYDALTKEYLAALDEVPLDALAYGERKAKIEAKAVLKDAQLLFAARKSGVEIAYQGQRNLLAMLRTCLEAEGSTLADYARIIDDPAALAACLTEHAAKLDAFLARADSDPATRDAVLGAMARSPHNRNATEPTDKNSLPSSDLYAFELLETAPGQVLKWIEHEIAKAVDDVDALPMDTLRPWIKDRISRYDGGDKSGRQAMLLRIIADLKKLVPELAEAEFESLGFSDAMKAKAEVRFAAYREAHGAEFEKLKRLAITKALEQLNKAFSASFAFYQTFAADLEKDTGPVLQTLGELEAMPGIRELIAAINAVATGDPPKLEASAAQAQLAALGQAVTAAIQPYNEAAGPLAEAVEAAAPNVLVAAATQMKRALDALPAPMSRPTKLPMHLFVMSIQDLAEL